MSVGGSNPSSPTGATGDQPTTATINSPIAKGPNAPEAPGGKGGFPAAQNPYGQQQSQVYMPPSQPTFYDQAFSRQYYQPQYAQPRYALGSLRAGPSNNAYVRPYSSPSPFNVQQTNPMEASPPPGEHQYSGDYSPQYSYLNRRPQIYAQSSPMGQMPQIMPGAAPVAATQGVVSDNINHPAYQQQLAASNMTDYQRLMGQRQMASQPQQNQYGLGGLNPISRAPSDLEIANSLGYKDPNAGMVTSMQAKMPHEYAAENAAKNAKAKEYLNSIGYGQAGFDASKYEVKRQPVSTGPSTGLGSLMTGFRTNPMIG